MGNPWQAHLVRAGVVLGILTLSGCVTFAADLVVSKRDAVSGTIVVAYAESILDLVNQDPELNDWQRRYERLDGVSVRGFDRDGQMGNQVVLKDVPIEAFSTAGNGTPPIRILREGDYLRVSGRFDFSGYSEDVGGNSETYTTRLAFFSPADLRVSIQVPGEILSTNGSVDDATNTITWKLRLGQDNRLDALVDSPQGLPQWLFIAGGGAVAVGLIVAVAIVFAGRVRRRPPDTMA